MKQIKKIVLIPDSFKGTLSSTEICSVMNSSIKNVCGDMDVVSIPVADGGEGTIDCFLSILHGEKINVSVSNPFFEKMQSYYAVINKTTAIVEVAACIGLPMFENRKNPLTASSFGVGELIAAAVDKGCKEVIIGLGGSCTNDCGCGCAAALGVRFFDEQGGEFIPVGGTLDKIAKIDMSGLNPKIGEVDIRVMCDIDNPLCGENGAAYVFAPQKGADPQAVRQLDENMKAFAKVLEALLGQDISKQSGAGAAGGLGAGLVAFLGGKLQSGIDVVLDLIKFDELIKSADLIITGEGRLDSQSVGGKVIAGIAKRAKAKQKPVVAVVGDIGEGIDPIYDMGVTAVVSINRRPMDFAQSRHFSKENLAAAINDLIRILMI